ncbi:EAL domain-containing protein [Novosphingobium profundi]|uniref:putative bifunctional diguanylate cyclase/phosphodiesterase n=1 Tax=Novosphingobium profundi TaxID=1774954 RepID=UPI001BDA6614|nr:EAL domain-containing protein [Novosphingobium profundi]MBT0669777.1 EAL domain-containing protein [Novosphingobium profundi]
MARERDRVTALSVLAQSTAQVDRSIAVGATSRRLRVAINAGRPDTDWLDAYTRRWFSGYAGLDETYLLNGRGDCVYALREGRRAVAPTYIAVEDHADALVALARSRLAAEPASAAKMPARRPPLADIRILRGRPALLVVQPVPGANGGEGRADAGGAFVVGVTFLDGALFDALARNFSLSGMHFQSIPSRTSPETSVPLRARSGTTIGYLAWNAFDPGTRVLSALAPVALVVVLLAASIVYVLASRLVRRTRDLEESRTEAQYQALHDPLTGLANRILFEAQLDQALDRCRDGKASLALLCIDLDRFKQINDTLGHPAGDELIRQVAQRLRAQVRETDIVARMGGDEFAVVINDPQDRAAVEAISTRIVEDLARPFALAGAKAFIGASLGVVLSPQDCVLRTELSRRVDISLYAAKAGGRGRYVFFSSEMDEDIREREGVVQALRVALHEAPEQFRVHYQPIYSSASGMMTAVEALVRWEHPERGLVGPGEFIDQAEESGLIEPLGELVLRQALRDARTWPDLRISVNVSPSQMQEPSFAETVRVLLEEAGVSGHRLELELTETVLMGSSSDVARTIASLRQMGVACALDDFGTGYSSLSHIRDMAVDRIKVDRSFVQAIETPRGAAIVEAIVNLAKVNGLQVTAEGVETEGQMRFLRELGCHELQGFAFSRPIPAGDLEYLVATGAVTATRALARAENGDWAI